MQVAAIVMHALWEQDPQEFKRLSVSGELDLWRRARVAQANEIYYQLTDTAEKLPNGVVRDPALKSLAEELALAAVLDL